MKPTKQLSTFLWCCSPDEGFKFHVSLWMKFYSMAIQIPVDAVYYAVYSEVVIESVDEILKFYLFLMLYKIVV